MSCHGPCRSLETPLIKLKVPELLKKREMSASELMRKANVAYVTALKLAKADTTAISFDVLNSLCKLFDVGVEDILEYVPDEDED